jgi:hypothetical protein
MINENEECGRKWSCGIYAKGHTKYAKSLGQNTDNLSQYTLYLLPTAIGPMAGGSVT